MKKILEHVFPKLEIDTNMAIIGSGAQLLEFEMGDEIDNFAEVVRFNRAPTKGFEKHVGSKTTLRIANNHVFANVPHANPNGKPITGWSAVGQPEDFILQQRNQRIMLLTSETKHWDNRDTNIHESCEAFLGEYIVREGLLRPSLGFAFIMLCLQSDIKPTLFGFGIEEDSTRASHYWEDKMNIGTSHEYGGERESLKIWAKDKTLIIR